MPHWSALERSPLTPRNSMRTIPIPVRGLEEMELRLNSRTRGAERRADEPLLTDGVVIETGRDPCSALQLQTLTQTSPFFPLFPLPFSIFPPPHHPWRLLCSAAVSLGALRYFGAE
ncbi:hypothetical protein E2C01_088646 [Portunus trituberculatus]|uniref:Uncharacterized protein n=1 Tax=Portunus trituberculatus TaxID=210409 RepID=A0A5B7JMF8_PORTR|nr:hypothetical protein [Portunus trituberculatus]